MSDLAKILESIRRSERWRSWLAIIVMGGFGLFLVIASLADGLSNQDTKGCLVFGLIFAACGALFLVRVLRMRETYARAAELISRGEVARIFEQEGNYKGRRFWNFFIWTTGRDRLRVAVFREPQYVALRTQLGMLAPQALEPWTRKREREFKASAA